MKKEQANLEQYIAQKTLDGLYLMTTEEEKAIRKDPVGASANLIGNTPYFTYQSMLTM